MIQFGGEKSTALRCITRVGKQIADGRNGARRNSYGAEFTEGEETDKRRTKEHTAATPIKRQKGGPTGGREKEGGQ